MRRPRRSYPEITTRTTHEFPLSHEKLYAAARTRFLSAWISKYYEKQEEEDADERDAAELEQLMRMGVYRDWDRKRVRLKPAAAKKREKPVKKIVAGSKKH